MLKLREGDPNVQFCIICLKCPFVLCFSRLAKCPKKIAGARICAQHATYPSNISNITYSDVTVYIPMNGGVFVTPTLFPESRFLCVWTKDLCLLGSETVSRRWSAEVNNVSTVRLRYLIREKGKMEPVRYQYPR